MTATGRKLAFAWRSTFTGALIMIGRNRGSRATSARSRWRCGARRRAVGYQRWRLRRAPLHVHVRRGHGSGSAHLSRRCATAEQDSAEATAKAKTFNQPGSHSQLIRGPEKPGRTTHCDGISAVHRIRNGLRVRVRVARSAPTVADAVLVRIPFEPLHCPCGLAHVRRAAFWHFIRWGGGRGSFPLLLFPFGHQTR